MRVNAGVYKTSNELFAQFKEIHMHQLPDYKVLMEVPPECEVEFGKGLRDFLGFSDDRFKTGRYVSRYPLELDAGISEIFVYSDIVSSSHVGDSYAPLLRIIPCSNEKGEQIVKHYETPIYFPLRKHFFDSVEIELGSASGEKIVFSGGKTIVCLSFRRKSPINMMPV